MTKTTSAQTCDTPFHCNAIRDLSLFWFLHHDNLESSPNPQTMVFMYPSATSWVRLEVSLLACLSLPILHLFLTPQQMVRIMHASTKPRKVAVILRDLVSVLASFVGTPALLREQDGDPRMTAFFNNIRRFSSMNFVEQLSLLQYRYDASTRNQPFE